MTQTAQVIALQVVGMMDWVAPKVTAADRLKTRGWEPNSDAIPSLHNLQALTRREKRR